MLFDRTQFNLDIPAIARFAFLNTADQGPKLACVHYAVQELENDVFYNSPSRADVYDRLHAATEESRRRLAAFFHAPVAQTAFVRGIADGLNLLLPHFALGPGDEVVTTDQENPAVLLPLLEGAREEALAARENVVLSESFARKVFGTFDPLGQTLRLVRRRGRQEVLDVRQVHRGPPLSAELVAFVDQDLQDPGAEPRRVPQAAAACIGGADGLLHGVLRIFVLAEDGLGGAEHGLLIPDHLIAECFLVQRKICHGGTERSFGFV